MNTRVLMSALFFLANAAFAAETFTADQLKAQFPYDLGASDIDVSGYPAAKKTEYDLFRRTCSQCHTLARPINSPIATEAQWRRYVRRMKVRTQAHSHAKIPAESIEPLVDFLVYDSKIRKTDRKESFAAESERLRLLFKDMVAERRRQGVSDDQKKVKQYPNDAAAGPTPRP
ncbi:MAG: hypothetical protein ACHQ51_03930 [Elusimicrobiota bacterium]